MMIRAWHPSAAPDTEIAAWCALNNACTTIDVPEDPTWVTDGLREWLSINHPHEKREFVVAEDHGSLIGGAEIQFPLVDNVHRANIKILVHPEHRRRGIGTRLLDELTQLAAVQGRITIATDLPTGTAGTAFAEPHGFTLGRIDLQSLLAFADINWDHINHLAQQAPAGYSLRYWVD
jgi:GNAT superfamily N-acetyltransferase